MNGNIIYKGKESVYCEGNTKKSVIIYTFIIVLHFYIIKLIILHYIFINLMGPNSGRIEPNVYLMALDSISDSM